MFIEYADLANVLLKKKKIVCVFSSKLINHICYADDMILLCPFLSKLQELVRVHEDFTAEYGLTYIVNKTEYIGFQPENKKC